MGTRHEIKYTRKTHTYWCVCRKWRLKDIPPPWTGAENWPSPELIDQVEFVMAEFEKHKNSLKECK